LYIGDNVLDIEIGMALKVLSQLFGLLNGKLLGRSSILGF
jgi:hypothetical protein